MNDGAGRYAPSPTGDLHLGNLRTAMLAWLYARSTDRRLWLRFEDLDTGRADPAAAGRQLADLLALGLDVDGDPVVQSDRIERYRTAIDDLTAAGRTYRCWCTRREIHAAVSAPHAPPGAYPGTCRRLTAEQIVEREASGRPPAIRLRADIATETVTDLRFGSYTGVVDDFVLQRGDGTPAYNLAVVVDDIAMGVDQVVRGDDLLDSAPRQAHLTALLGGVVPEYAHVPLVLGRDGARLAKRDGAVTLRQRLALGETSAQVRSALAASLHLAAPGEVVDMADLLDRFDPALLPTEPWTLTPEPCG
ncbi:tRNA glutamyl-Q(34) synthetase GluQRS [Millisia brevis]|uniref:tRNA glutamyl-Q(34) synthetase GluQRS n=1 Tax=Millisia brevis TaxID=264148 RepID=UPI0008296E7F|nr:tRNA glutamyl-Q(34) synthetase GluQRS [Millisia brevis]